MRFFSTRWAVLTLCLAGLSFSGRTAAQGADAMAQAPNHDLIFSDLPKRWDEGIPLGNGLLGALVWQKEGHLRMSLDRADLWDNRKAFHIEKMTYQWVLQKYLAGQYDSVHQIGDDPYDESPYPTKIPAAALEFDMQPLGAVQSVRLDIRSALCHVTWATGAVFNLPIYPKVLSLLCPFPLTIMECPVPTAVHWKGKVWKGSVTLRAAFTGKATVGFITNLPPKEMGSPFVYDGTGRVIH